MDAFEYLSVLVSIVLGLGITQLLVGFARWLTHRGRYRVYSPAIAWAAFLLLLHIQTWWSMYGMRQYSNWNFLQFSVVLLQPIVLFLLAAIVLPGADATHDDLREYFRYQRKWFFSLLLSLVGISLLKDLVRDTLPAPLNLGFHAVFASLSLAGLAWAGDRAQRVAAWVALSAFTVYIAILFAEL